LKLGKKKTASEKKCHSLSTKGTQSHKTSVGLISVYYEKPEIRKKDKACLKKVADGKNGKMRKKWG